MRELKILLVVAFFSGLTYYLVEPFAHHEMHKKVDAQGKEIKIESNGFMYSGKSDVSEARRKGDVALASAKESFWRDVERVSSIKGDPVAGEAAFASCMGCHSGSNMNMGGVIPPNLDHAGSLYAKEYLVALIKDPAMASNVDHKYADTSAHPMGSVKFMVSTDEDIADVVAYILKEKSGEVSPKEAFSEACSRCHAMRYSNMTQLGDTPAFKNEKEALAHRIKVLEEQDAVKAYMGKLPPDLSMIIRARSPHFMETFIQNPQSQLPGTSMPRVGLSEDGYRKVEAYLEEVGDPSKPKREALGPVVIGFFVLFAFLAFMWKRHQWRDLH